MSTEAQASGGTQTLEGGSLLEEILAETKMTPGDEGYEIAKRGVQAFIAELITPKREGEKVDKALVDALIAEIDVKLSHQMDEIIHHPTFQKLESAWRSLKFVIDRTDFQALRNSFRPLAFRIVHRVATIAARRLRRVSTGSVLAMRLDS